MSLFNCDCSIVNTATFPIEGAQTYASRMSEVVFFLRVNVYARTCVRTCVVVSDADSFKAAQVHCLYSELIDHTLLKLVLIVL